MSYQNLSHEFERGASPSKRTFDATRALLEGKYEPRVLSSMDGILYQSLPAYSRDLDRDARGIGHYCFEHCIMGLLDKESLPMAA